jgi:myosin heavy subunit
MASARDIVNKYLKFAANEAAFSIGKGAFSDNKFVWAAVDKDKYVVAELLKESGNKLTVRSVVDAKEMTIDKDAACFVNPPKFDGVEDCAQLGHLHEPGVLHNLKVRYEKDVIYVSPNFLNIG